MNRLTDLNVQEISLVDDPAVPAARYLVVKSNRPKPAISVAVLKQTLADLDRQVNALADGIVRGLVTTVTLADRVAAIEMRTNAANDPDFSDVFFGR
jgi:hypothetical protein